jgi:molybdopterin biosynthesis enzyme
MSHTLRQNCFAILQRSCAVDSKERLRMRLRKALKAIDIIYLSGGKARKNLK